MLLELLLASHLSTNDACQFDTWITAKQEDKTVALIETQVTCPTDVESAIMEDEMTLVLRLPHHMIFIALPEKGFTGHIRYKLGKEFAYLDNGHELETATMSREEI